MGGKNAGYTNQQNTVTVYNASFTAAAAVAAATQGKTGACDDANASYWDIGVRGDTAPGNHSGGTLGPQYSLLTNATEAAAGSNNRAGNALLAATYCNGARVPVEASVIPGSISPYAGWEAPPGTNESNPLNAPAFTLQASGCERG